MTKTKKVLNFIRRSRNGRTFGEIQRYIVEMNGKDYDDRHTVIRMRSNGRYYKLRVRIWRGYWCDYLCDRTKMRPRYDTLGARHYWPTKQKGLLSRFCYKIGNRYYHRSNNWY